MTKLVLFLLAMFGISLGQGAHAAGLKKYRWQPKVWKPLPYLFSASLERVVSRRAPEVPIVVGLAGLIGRQTLLPAKGELVQRGEQSLGPAHIDGTWMQTIFKPDGHVLYAAGAVFDDLPGDEWLTRVKRMQSEAKAAEEIAVSLSEDFRWAGKRFSPEVRLRKLPDETFEAYWRFEYLTRTRDRLFFLLLSEKGTLLETGEISIAAADGRAQVYPFGPKRSQITEVPLHQLNGDGTLTSRFFRMTSALDLDVNSPSLLFFFPDTDRRFDLAQVYFTIERSLSWMRSTLGAELKTPLEVRLHVGENGVSNAAFYHEDVIYLGAGDGITYKDLPRDPSIVTHESIHAMIDAYAGLPSEGEGGAFNEGFADFFTALILKNPHMGDSAYLKGPYRRTVENDLRAYEDFTGGIYRDGSIVAATLWDLRSVVSDEKLATLAFRTLVRLGSGASFADFVPALLNASMGLLTAEEERAVLAKVQARGWVLVP